MEKKGIFLKLGGCKHLGEERWRGALNVFDEIYCAYTYRETGLKINATKVHLFELEKNSINRIIIGILQRSKYHSSLAMLNSMLIKSLRRFNRDWLNNIKTINPDYVLCSYGDYDMSDLVLLITRPAITAQIVRAYKESRVGFNYLEFHALKKADKIVLYDIELKRFIENKYGEDFFEGKNVLVGYDENALPSCIVDNVGYREKLSVVDKRIHMVILSFRADSAPNRERDQGRYYYADVIRKFIEAGIVVHLHCAQYNDYNGKNIYKMMTDEYVGYFYMEPPLSMRHDSTTEEWISACETLSRYDIGLLHNIVDNSSVSEFDRINVPHRFFAYEAAHVVPVIKQGENIVLERMFKEKNCGFIYDSLNDLNQVRNHEFDFFTPTYEDYLKNIFNLKD